MRRAHYRDPVLFFVPIQLILTHYCGLSLRGSTNDKTVVLTIALAAYVLMACAMFVIDASDAARPWYYTVNNEFYMLSGGVFLLIGKQFGALKYFGLYRFALCMGTDSVWMFLAIHLCLQVL